MFYSKDLFHFSFVVFSVYFLSLSTIAYAQPRNLPDSAKVHAAPFRVMEIEHQGLKALLQLRYTTVDSPNYHITTAGNSADGIGKLILARSDFTVGCTGTLLSTGQHILTAAHCITDEFGNVNLNSGTITFEVESGDVTLNISASVVHPDWDGDAYRGNDLALLELDNDAPTEIPRFDINRTGNIVGNVGDKFGYGLSGLGTIDSNFPFGTKRGGQNKYDSYADTMLSALGLRRGKDFVRQSVIQYDFDNGLSANDAFGFFFGIEGLGLGSAEINSAPGDSGGPTNRLGVVVGVTSYGITLIFNNGTTSDTSPDVINSSVGEFAGDTNVAKYSAWIDDVTGMVGTESSNCSRGQARKGLC